MIEEDDLNCDSFSMYPVWCWTADNEHYQPVLNYSPLPEDRGNLFIKAKLISADGESFNGSIIGYESYHALSIFHEGQEYTLNLRSKHLLNMGLGRLWKGLNREIENFFPITFKTNLLYESGKKVEGVLQPKFWK